MIVISGGQSGVDRAALDVAMARGIDYAGWCPRGGWAEDFPAPPGLLAHYPKLLAHYPKLKETPLTDPAQRTEWNVRDADACLIVLETGGIEVSRGTALARELAHRYRKPLFIADLAGPDMLKDATLWLRVQAVRHGAGLKLAIGGPRESEAPGIYARAKHFIDMLLAV
jgi:Circularly permutated YpsA SLOG family